ncbi:PP2C family protein-serine/threonine phosphatase [Leptospira alstonii]|uniref:Stage II sporulation protein E n=2 Tax=Leptospira alstonii TaxID=28452 RepID=M6CZT7_9LEPT|nr:PP2C family protein-serine/threonine phosphatase [Leptospira alstonii]EMJ95951.1 stage II sporulation protein E [Leptospira alstonii serovar Sichuan str. 79601]EQA79911.1 SpoIIE-like protein phosphatase domain protein [Leptospira alstonii serovar Pingchang str. 80-412]
MNLHQNGATNGTQAKANAPPDFNQFAWVLEKKWIEIVCVLGFVLIPVFGGLDYFIIPPQYLNENLGFFFMLRGAASLIVLTQFFILKNSKPGRWNAIHAYFFTFVVGGIISVMTVRLGGFESSYYAGLNLVLIAVNLFLPWNALKGALNSVIIVAQYLAANFIFDHDYEIISIINNLYFMLGTAIISVTIAHFKFSLTKSEFEKMNLISNLKSQQDGDYFLTSLILRPLSLNRSKSESVLVEFYTSQKKKFTFKIWNEEIGGDICVSHNIRLKGRDYIVFVNADAMGKSMQGAGGALVFGAVFHALVQRTKFSENNQDQHPERWLKNTVIEMQKTFESFDGAMMISMVIGLIDEKNGLLYYINAEHPFPVLFRDGKASYIDSEIYFKKVGMLGLTSRLFVSIFQMAPDDVLIFGSDGRDDVMVFDPETKSRLIIEDDNFFLNVATRGQGDLNTIVKELYQSGEIIDDLSLLKIRFQPVESNSTNGDWKGNIQGLSAQERLTAIRQKLNDGIRNPEILKEAVSLSFRYGAIEEAVDHAKEIVYRFPGETKYLYFLSRELSRQKNFTDSIDFGERFRHRKPGHKNNLLVLSNSYRRVGNIERAELLLKEIIGIDPRNELALNLMQKLINE